LFFPPAGAVRHERHGVAPGDAADEDRSLRGHRTRGTRRHGSRLSRPRHGARARSGHQGHVVGLRRRRDGAPPVLPRGPCSRETPAPQHRHDLRVRRGRRDAVHRDGVPAGPGSLQAHARRAVPRARAEARDHRRALHRPALRARTGRHPPRRQAGEHLAGARRFGQAARLRHREVRLVHDDSAGVGPRQHFVHVARAGQRPRGRWPRRRLFRRRGALRAVDREEAVRGRFADRGPGADHGRPAGVGRSAASRMRPRR
jgi:hypothetical protein